MSSSMKWEYKIILWHITRNSQKYSHSSILRECFYIYTIWYYCKWYCFLNFNCTLLVYREIRLIFINWSCILNSNIFFIDYLRHSTCTIMSNEQFFFSFLVYKLALFTCLNALARTFRTCWLEVVRISLTYSGHQVKAFNFSPLSMWFIKVFHRCLSSDWGNSLLFLVESFYHKLGLNFIQMLFIHLLQDHLAFLLCSINMVNYTHFQC